MKQHFSPLWNASIQPRKQRKYLANAPFHIRHQVLSANLSKELRKKYGKRSFPVRKGDEVKVMRGELKKKIGKIDIVDLKNYRITLEGIQRTKKDGTKIKVFFHPSNLQIKELNLDDKKRKEALERKKVQSRAIIKTEITKPEPAAHKIETTAKAPVIKKTEEAKRQEPKHKTEIKTKIKPTQSSSSKNEELATKAKKNAPKKIS